MFIYHEPGGGHMEYRETLYVESLEEAEKEAKELLLSGDWPGIDPGDMLVAWIEDENGVLLSEVRVEWVEI